MSPVREHYNPLISKLLREHDQLPHDQIAERKSVQRKIIFLMNTIKFEEYETSFAWCSNCISPLIDVPTKHPKESPLPTKNNLYKK